VQKALARYINHDEAANSCNLRWCTRLIGDLLGRPSPEESKMLLPTVPRRPCAWLRIQSGRNSRSFHCRQVCRPDRTSVVDHISMRRLPPRKRERESQSATCLRPCQTDMAGRLAIGTMDPVEGRTQQRPFQMNDRQEACHTGNRCRPGHRNRLDRMIRPPWLSAFSRVFAEHFLTPDCWRCIHDRQCRDIHASRLPLENNSGRLWGGRVWY